MNKVNLKEKFPLFEEYWTPKILGELNENHIHFLFLLII
jgi:hypothetical protein